MRAIKTVLLGMTMAMFSAAAFAENDNGTLVQFRCGDTTLRGYLYKPQGDGPFPAVVHVRSNNKIADDSMPLFETAKFFTGRGYVFFLPTHRTSIELRTETHGVPVKRKRNAMDLPEFESMTKDIA